MKKGIIVLFILLTTFVGFNASYAAFPIKHAPAANEANAATAKNEDAQAAQPQPKAQRHGFFTKLRSAKASDGNGSSHSHSQQGWPGITALACGIGACILWALGSALVIPLGIAALVFGIVGLNRKRYKNYGMSLAGLIIGGTITLLLILAIILFAAIFAI